jgi:hypothetical protein
MKPNKTFKQLLKSQRYSKETIDKMWKWYDYAEKKGVASY